MQISLQNIQGAEQQKGLGSPEHPMSMAASDIELKTGKRVPRNSNVLVQDPSIYPAGEQRYLNAKGLE